MGDLVFGRLELPLKLVGTVEKVVRWVAEWLGWWPARTWLPLDEVGW